MKEKVLLLLFVAVLVLGACGPEPIPCVTSETQLPGTYIIRLIDHEAEVVCWIYTRYNLGGISCLPLGDTALEGLKE